MICSVQLHNVATGGSTLVLRGTSSTDFKKHWSRRHDAGWLDIGNAEVFAADNLCASFEMLAGLQAAAVHGLPAPAGATAEGQQLLRVTVGIERGGADYSMPPSHCRRAERSLKLHPCHLRWSTVMCVAVPRCLVSGKDRRCPAVEQVKPAQNQEVAQLRSIHWLVGI